MLLRCTAPSFSICCCCVLLLPIADTAAATAAANKVFDCVFGPKCHDIPPPHSIVGDEACGGSGSGVGGGSSGGGLRGRWTQAGGDNGSQGGCESG
jgi:hypothetical protein